MAQKTASEKASSASAQATKALVLDDRPAVAGVEPSARGCGSSVSGHEASSTTGTRTTVSSTIIRPRPSRPRA